MVLAVCSENLSVVLRDPWLIVTSDKRTVARCEHVIFCCGSDHCFCSRYLRASAAVFTTPGAFSMSVLSCWSVCWVVVALREGGLPVAFPLSAGGSAVGSLDMFDPSCGSSGFSVLRRVCLCYGSGRCQVQELPAPITTLAQGRYPELLDARSNRTSYSS